MPRNAMRALCAISRRVRSLQKTLRVDVDFKTHAGRRLRGCGKPGTQMFRQIEAAGRFDEQPEPVPSANDRNRRVGRSEHADFLTERRASDELAGKSLRARAIRPGG